MKTTLVVMAAGIGSRFGGGIKQLEPVGMHQEIIMDYSIHDAIAAGFNKIIVVIRKEIEEDFREIIGNRMATVCERNGVELHYVFQDLQAIPDGFSVPEGRGKPWGTGQAVLAAKDCIHEPFMVVNADDYYGQAIFRKFHTYLSQPQQAYCMAGYDLANTLSDNGSVTRGICKAEDDMLVSIEETHHIEKTADGVVADQREIPLHSVVSMNMWGFPSANDWEAPGYLQLLEEDFTRFFREEVAKDPLKAEFLLPIHIGDLLQAGKAAVKILPTCDKWIGITYQQDMANAKEKFRQLIQDGVYQEDLYADLG